MQKTSSLMLTWLFELCCRMLCTALLLWNEWSFFVCFKVNNFLQCFCCTLLEVILLLRCRRGFFFFFSKSLLWTTSCLISNASFFFSSSFCIGLSPCLFSMTHQDMTSWYHSQRKQFNLCYKSTLFLRSHINILGRMVD